VSSAAIFQQPARVSPLPLSRKSQYKPSSNHLSSGVIQLVGPKEFSSLWGDSQVVHSLSNMKKKQMCWDLNNYI
jgi:hypothetical protein